MNFVKKIVVTAVTVSVLSTSMVANAQPKVMKDGTVFDAEYYAQRYADVVAVYGTEEASLFQHYTDYGRSENREAVKAPSKATFDAEYYANNNPDVVAVYGTGSNNLYQHYLQYGKEEGRKPTASAASSSSAKREATAPEATAHTETSAANTMTYAEAQRIWNNFWDNNEYLSFFDDAILTFFDENGDHNISQEEGQFLYDWVRYGNDTNKTNNALNNPLDEQEMIAIATQLQSGHLTLPASLRKVAYVQGVWVLY